MRSVLLHAEGLAKRYGQKVVLEDVDFDVHGGEAVAVVGENGAGKTTLLQIAVGLIAPDGGTVAAFAPMGYCPQEPGLVDLLTVDEHLEYFGAARGLHTRPARELGRALLSELGMPADEVARVGHLSGGNRQKLNLALALLGDPGILLLDEPYQGFDHGSYLDFWEHVGTWRQEGRAVVVVTHMLAELHRVDRVIELDSRSGGYREVVVS